MAQRLPVGRAKQAKRDFSKWTRLYTNSENVWNQVLHEGCPAQCPPMHIKRLSNL